MNQSTVNLDQVLPTTATTLDLRAGDIVETAAGTVRLVECTLDEAGALDCARKCTETHWNAKRVSSGHMTQEQADHAFERIANTRAWRSVVVKIAAHVKGWGGLDTGREWTVQGNHLAIWRVIERNGG